MPGAAIHLVFLTRLFLLFSQSPDALRGPYLIVKAAPTTALPVGQRQVPEDQLSSGATILLDLLTEDNEKFNGRSTEMGVTRVRAIDWRAAAPLHAAIITPFGPCTAIPSQSKRKNRTSCSGSHTPPDSLLPCPPRSPVGLAPGGGCLLAVCTTDGRLRVYRMPHGRSLQCQEEFELSGLLLEELTAKGSPVRPRRLREHLAMTCGRHACFQLQGLRSDTVSEIAL